MTASTIFASLDSKFVGPINAFISTGVAGVSNWIAGPLMIGVSLYVVINGFLILRGNTCTPFMDFVFKILKLGIIIMLVKNAADYDTYVKALFFDSLPLEIGSAVQGNATLSASQFDALIDKGLYLSVQILKSSYWPTAMMLNGLLAIFVMIVSCLLASIGFIVSLYAKVALAIVISLGPIFIALAMFDATRRFTEAWIGQVVNFSILQILVLTLGSLILSVVQSLFDNAANIADVLLAAIQFGAISFSAAYIFYQLPNIASSLASGGASLAYGFSAGRDLANNAAIRAIRSFKRKNS